MKRIKIIFTLLIVTILTTIIIVSASSNGTDSNYEPIIFAGSLDIDLSPLDFEAENQ